MADSRYLDFDLHVWSEGDHFAVQVTHSPVGRSERVELRWPFGESIEVVLLRIEYAVLKSQMRGMRGGPMSADEKILRDFGSSMFKAVFKDDERIARRFNGSLDYVEAQRGKIGGLRVKLTIEPPELSMLPWEYVFDESFHDPLQSYLCLRSRSPFVRFLDIGDMQAFETLQPPLKILGMIANPGGAWEALDVEAERNRIDQAIDQVGDKSRIKFRWVKGDTPELLQMALEEDDWHVFHFIGHGGTDVYTDAEGKQRSEGYVVFADGLGGAVKVSPSQLALRLQDSGRLRLAVLNCCESGRHAGAALVRSGLPSVVAMQFKVSNDAAVRFASVFYASLLSGKSVEKALTAARVTLQLYCGVEWATPVLFTRIAPDVLFDAALDRDTGAPSAPASGIAAPILPAQAPLSAAPPASRKQLAQDELRRMFAGIGG
jgi:hypothetical protein